MPYELSMNARRCRPVEALDYLCAVDPLPAFLAGASPADRLRPLAFDAELSRLARPFLDALWEELDALDRAGVRTSSLAASAGGVRPAPELAHRYRRLS
jgi:hypothetical protein